MTSIAAPAPVSEGSNRDQHGFGLRDVRHACGLSLRDVEGLTGINRGHVSTVERGIEIPTPGTLRTLSDLYGVSLDSWQVVVEYRVSRETFARLRERRGS